MLVPNRKELKKRRIEMNLSQRQLCKMCGLPSNAISRLESGDSKFTYPIRAKAVASAMNCKVEDLFLNVNFKGDTEK